MKEAAVWIDDRLSDAPSALRTAMRKALPQSATSVPEAFAEAAMRLYGEVVRGDGSRADALPLLAADALLTHAFEAQAELDPAGIESLAAHYGARGRLGEISKQVG